MCEINSNYLKLPGSYLFAGIKRRVDGSPASQALPTMSPGRAALYKVTVASGKR